MSDPMFSVGAAMAARIKRERHASLLEQLDAVLFDADCPLDLRVHILARLNIPAQRWLNTCLRRVDWVQDGDDDQDGDTKATPQRDGSILLEPVDD